MVTGLSPHTNKVKLPESGSEGKAIPDQGQSLPPGRLSTGTASQHWLDISHLEACEIKQQTPQTHYALQRWNLEIAFSHVGENAWYKCHVLSLGTRRRVYTEDRSSCLFLFLSADRQGCSSFPDSLTGNQSGGHGTQLFSHSSLPHRVGRTQ